MSGPAVRVIFFSNGNTAVFDAHGAQIVELQRSWLLTFVQFLEDKGVDVGACDFSLPVSGNRVRLFRTIDQKWNWSITQ